MRPSLSHTAEWSQDRVQTNFKPWNGAEIASEPFHIIGNHWLEPRLRPPGV
jgi:hypothetical protein